VILVGLLLELFDPPVKGDGVASFATGSQGVGRRAEDLQLRIERLFGVELLDDLARDLGGDVGVFLLAAQRVQHVELMFRQETRSVTLSRFQGAVH
jgi:hypothetical protein